MPDLTFAAALRFAQDLIRIPSLPGEEGALARRVRDELDALGFRDVRIDDSGNVLGRAPGRGDGPAVMLSSHLDAVDVGDPAGWERQPFAGEVSDGFLHGRGAMDIKGPLALQTYAAAAFLADPAAGDVIVAHTVLEERGGLGMARLLESRTVRPSAVILGEATHGDVCIGHRGRAETLVEIHGLAGHASAPDRAHNPVALLPRVVQALESFAAQLDEDPLVGPSTLAPTALETLPRSRNVIPDRVRIVLDWRILPGLTPELAARRLHDHLSERIPDPAPYRIHVALAQEDQTTWTGIRQQRPMFTPGFLLPPTHPVALAAARAILDATGRRPAVRPWTFATDGGHTCGVHGIPTIGFAPGEERFAHTNRERLALDEAEQAYALYPALIRAVQAAA